MFTELENIKWDIIGLSGTEIKQTANQILPCGHQLFNSGNETSRHNGTRFLVHKSIARLVINYQSIFDRLAVLTLKANDNKIKSIQIYCPTTSHLDEEVEMLHDQVQQLISKTPKRDFLFLMGDFNARIGGLGSDYPSCIGKYTIGESNSRGDTLASFCSLNNLFITNNCFKKPRFHTWNHPNGRNVGQIDFITARNNHKRNILDICNVLNTPDVSDHRMVRAKIKVKIKWPRHKKTTRKYNVDALQDASKLHQFQLKLSNRFEQLSTLSNYEDVDQGSKNINETILAVADKVLPQEQKPTPRWMSSDNKAAIDKRKIRKEKGEKSISYKIAKAETKKLVKRDRINNINDDLDQMSKLPANKQFFLAMKKTQDQKGKYKLGY